MKKYFIFILLAVTLFSASGCLVTRFSQIVFETGRLHCYADCSKAADNVVYRIDDRYYIKARQAVYQDTPAVLGLFMPVIYFCSHKMKATAARPSVLVELDKEAVLFMTAQSLPDDAVIPFTFGKIPDSGKTDLKNAEKIPILRNLPAPEIALINGSRPKILDAVPLGTQRTTGGYFALLLLPGAFILDIPASCVCNVFGYCFAVPGMLLKEAYEVLLDMGGNEIDFSDKNLYVPKELNN